MKHDNPPKTRAIARDTSAIIVSAPERRYLHMLVTCDLELFPACRRRQRLAAKLR